MNQNGRQFQFDLPIVKCYDDPEDPNKFFIEGLASDISTDAREGRMDPQAIKMMRDHATSVVVDIEHSEDWPDQIGRVVAAKVLDAAPDGYERAEPPILWAQLSIDRMLSHGQDLYYKLHTLKERLGLSVFGYVKDMVRDDDGVMRRLDVIWTKLAITANPANRNAWVAELALSATDHELSVYLNKFDEILEQRGWIAALNTLLGVLADSIWSIYYSSDYDTAEQKREEVQKLIKSFNSKVKEVLASAKGGLEKVANNLQIDVGDSDDIDTIVDALISVTANFQSGGTVMGKNVNEQEVPKQEVPEKETPAPEAPQSEDNSELLAALTKSVADLNAKFVSLASQITDLTDAPKPAPQEPTPAPPASTPEDRMAALLERIEAKLDGPSVQDQVMSVLSRVPMVKRGLRFSGFSSEEDAKEQQKAMLAAGDVDGARQLFWVSVDRARGL